MEGPAYSYEGTYFRVPERQVFPKPHGPLHPAMWVAAGSPPTFTEAGELGLGAFCFTNGSPKQIAPLVANYKKAIVDATPVGDYVNDNIMGVTNMLCMEDRRKAFEVASNMGMNYYSSLAFHWLDNIPKPPGLPEWPEKIPEPTPEQVEKLSAEGYIAVGDPDDCVVSMRKWEEIGVDQMTLQPHHEHAARPRSSSSRWSCSAGRSSPSSTRTRCTPPPVTASGGRRGRHRGLTWWFAEVDPVGVEGFAEWVFPLAGVDAETVGGLSGWVAGWSGPGGGGEGSALVVGEGDAVGLVGVSGDAEVAVVVEAVVVGAEGDEVVGVGAAAVFPVGEVVDV